jgi:hypothetical protein
MRLTGRRIRAPQGCDSSADSDAGMAAGGSRPAPLPFWPESAKSRECSAQECLDVSVHGLHYSERNLDSAVVEMPFQMPE